MFLRLFRDDISPALTRLVATARHPAPVLRAMGAVFKSITEGNFNSVGAAFRPLPWKPKYDGSASNLYQSGTMARSFHLDYGETYAKLSNPMPYAAIHQFGGVIEAKGKALVWTDANGVKHFAKKVTMPARPFYPVLDGKLTDAAEKLIAAAGERAVLRQSVK